MEQRCKVTGETFDVSAEDLELLAKISPEFLNKKFLIPAPHYCPEVRLQQRLIFRNERFLYGRESDLSGKRILSVFSPNGPYKVYDQDEWWGDSWSGLSFGSAYQAHEDFFKQLNKLARRVPHIGLFTRNVENSYYSNYCLNTKDCYLAFGTTNSENSQYCKFVTSGRDCFDSLTVFRSELCYEAVCCSDCYNCSFITNCRNCTECISCLDCQSCKHCIGCYGLTSKDFHIFNEPVGKAKYEEYLKNFKDPSRQNLQDLNNRLKKESLNFPKKANYIFASEDCTGDALYNCKNCHDCFDLSESENSRYSAYMPKAINCLDCSYGAPDGIQYSYQLCSSVGSMNSMSTFLCWYCDSVFYCLECQNCKNCFGCVGLRNKEYCILNRQYTKAQYESLVPEIIEQMNKQGTWGEYFPAWCSYFSYNESLAQEYFPLSKAEAQSLGFGWRERPIQTTPADKLLSASELPERISKVKDSILENAIECKTCNRHFRYNAAELIFYNKLSIPPPDECPDCRHINRLSRRNPPILWERNCAKTGVNISTSFNPSRPEIVYCNEAWEKEFWGAEG